MTGPGAAPHPPSHFSHQRPSPLSPPPPSPPTPFHPHPPPPIPHPVPGDYTTRIAGEIKSLDCEGLVLRKWEKRIDGVMKYMMVAGKKVGGWLGGCALGRWAGGGCTWWGKRIDGVMKYIMVAGKKVFGWLGVLDHLPQPPPLLRRPRAQHSAAHY